MSTLIRVSTCSRAVGRLAASQAHLPARVGLGVGSYSHSMGCAFSTSTRVAQKLHETEKTSWSLPNAIYSREELESVKVVHHDATTASDKLARGLVAFARWGFDFVTRYKHASPDEALEALKNQGKDYNSMALDDLRNQGFVMTEKQWMARILFLESIAAVPGMVAGMLRHMKSVRRFRRDGGWIHSLLEEAENERMHLMTFLQIKKPSLFMRLVVLGAQGVFYNMFFIAYLLSAKAAHRFVGYLEEEACITYTQVINEIDRGHIPEWDPSKVAVPRMAIAYWKMDPDATMRDLILVVRADEASHRFHNHTFANLDQNEDSSPFRMHDVDGMEVMTRPGWTRDESLEWNKKIDVFVKSVSENKQSKASGEVKEELSQKKEGPTKKELDNRYSF